MVIYLLGDLAIYCAAVAKSLRSQIIELRKLGKNHFRALAHLGHVYLLIELVIIRDVTCTGPEQGSNSTNSSNEELPGTDICWQVMMKNLNLIKIAKRGKPYTKSEFISMNLFTLNEVQQMSMSIHKSQL